MFSCEYCETFKNTFFIGHLQTTASDLCDATAAPGQGTEEKILEVLCEKGVLKGFENFTAKLCWSLRLLPKYASYCGKDMRYAVSIQTSLFSNNQKCLTN